MPGGKLKILSAEAERILYGSIAHLYDEKKMLTFSERAVHGKYKLFEDIELVVSDVTVQQKGLHDETKRKDYINTWVRAILRLRGLVYGAQIRTTRRLVKVVKKVGNEGCDVLGYKAESVTARKKDGTSVTDVIFMPDTSGEYKLVDVTSPEHHEYYAVADERHTLNTSSVWGDISVIAVGEPKRMG